MSEQERCENEKIVAMLQIIRCNGNLLSMQTDDYPLPRIVDTFEMLTLEHYVYVDHTTTRLTEKGEDLYRQLCRQLGLRGIYRYIMPNVARRIPELDIDEMYIPNK